ncbi:MAG: hypothetical protein NVS1B3_16010 [Candidatus Dormibacteraceae bacterium]
MRSLGALVVGTVVSVVAVMVGVWWAPFLVGLAIGIAEPRARTAVPIGAAAGFLGWALPLVADQVLYGLGPTASSLAAIMGFGHQSVIPLAMTCAVGLLLGLSGAWLGSAGRSLVRPPARETS